MSSVSAVNKSVNFSTNKCRTLKKKSNKRRKKKAIIFYIFVLEVCFLEKIRLQKAQHVLTPISGDGVSVSSPTKQNVSAA